MAAEVSHAIRLAVTALLPASVGFLVLGLPIAYLAFGFGRGAQDAGFVGGALMALAVGLVPFTIQYLCLRAFYALEMNRTTFFLQCLIAGSNVLFATTAVLLLDRPSLVATGLAASYSAAYLIGVLVSFRRLRRELPDLSSEALVRHCVRLLLAVAPGAAAAWLICWALTAWSDTKLVLGVSLVLAGLVAIGLFVIMARLLKITEVTEILAVVFRRRGRGGGGSPSTGPRHAAPDTEDDLALPGDSDPAMGPARDTIENMAQAVVDPPGNAEPVEPSAAAHLPAGTVLGTRYRLEELITESAPTVTWRAFDQVLSRSVLVHLLPPAGPEGEEEEEDEPSESELLAAARQASVATDSRFIRVLDAVKSTDPELGSYIVCEYATGQSLDMILSQAPLSGLEAAWVVREVAGALAGVHSLDLYHRRINPGTVIITPTGNVKIMGLMIEAALRPAGSPVVQGADTPELVDVTDLGRLLYACLVSRWPGGPAYSLPDAPLLGRRWATPRQVRAGVSPALDQVCDQILGDPPRHRLPAITSAHDVVTALTKVLGSADGSADLERRLRQPVPLVGGRGGRGERVNPTTRATTSGSEGSGGVPPGWNTAPPVSSLLEHPGETEERRQPVAAATIRPPTVTRSVTVGQNGKVTGRRSPGAAKAGAESAARPQQRQPRRWIGLLLILAVLLVTGGVVAALVLDQRISSGAPPTTSTGSSAGEPTSATPSILAGPVSIADAREFDPQGDPPHEENSDEVPLAYDGNPTTRWRTVRYLGSPKLGNIKRGVGLVLDLGQPLPVREVQLSLSGSGTNVELRVPKGDPAQINKPPMSSDGRWRSVAKQSKAGATATLTPIQPVTTRYVLVYLTSLPKEGRGYQGGIYEVEVG